MTTIFIRHHRMDNLLLHYLESNPVFDLEPILMLVFLSLAYRYQKDYLISGHGIKVR